MLCLLIQHLSIQIKLIQHFIKVENENTDVFI